MIEHFFAWFLTNDAVFFKILLLLVWIKRATDFHFKWEVCGCCGRTYKEISHDRKVRDAMMHQIAIQKLPEEIMDRQPRKPTPAKSDRVIKGFAHEYEEGGEAA